MEQQNRSPNPVDTLSILPAYVTYMQYWIDEEG